MPDTPPKESSASVEEQDTVQSPPSNEQSAHQEFEAGGAQDMPMYESEVKEQDRWLPIANGWFFTFRPSHHSLHMPLPRPLLSRYFFISRWQNNTPGVETVKSCNVAP